VLCCVLSCCVVFCSVLSYMLTRASLLIHFEKHFKSVEMKVHFWRVLVTVVNLLF
jgi:hypothetical protein